MLRQAVNLWRSARQPCTKHAWTPARLVSEAAGPSKEAAKPTATASATASRISADAETVSKIFSKVTPADVVPPAAAASAAAAEEAPSTAGRVLSAIGNGLFISALGAAGFFGYYQYSYNVDQVQTMLDETKKVDNPSPFTSAWVAVLGWYADKRRQVEEEVKKYADPPSDKLLPDQHLIYPRNVVIKTLVLDLDDLLIHSNWTRERGWRTFKRPGVDEFLRQMAQYYEIVVYTSQQYTYADPILDKLDPGRQYIPYRLYRDSTQYVNGRHVRDLSKLNRDLRNVLFLSCDQDAWSKQPENAIKLPGWKGDPDDHMLTDLVPFLEAVVRTHVPDVRDVVKSYDGLDIPTAFKERMERVAAAQKQRKVGGRGFLAGKSS